MAHVTVSEAFAIQEGHCTRMGSPFTAALCRALPVALAACAETTTAQRVQDWPDDPEASAVPLRLCGALHSLVRQGQAPALTAVYPPVAETGPALDAALVQTLRDHDALIATLIAQPLQTNEIGRAGALIGGLMAVVARTNQPLEINEIGASAGLNLLLDHYAYDFGEERRMGPPDAPVTIACRWEGIGPLRIPPRITTRAGCDLAPVDPRDPEACGRLLSFVWADQTARLARTETALRHAATAPAPVTAADAGVWVVAMLDRPATPGATRVLMHSIVWQYLAPETRQQITTAMAVAGARATARNPLAWLRMERDATPGSAALSLTLWPGGVETQLARVDFHGAWVRWLAA